MVQSLTGKTAKVESIGHPNEEQMKLILPSTNPTETDLRDGKSKRSFVEYSDYGYYYYDPFDSDYYSFDRFQGWPRLLSYGNRACPLDEDT